MVAGDLDAERLVFVDEMGANVSLCPLYAWSRRGERASGRAPRNWRKTVTLLSSITADGIAVLAWRSKAPPRGRCSKPTWSGCSRPPYDPDRPW